MLKKPNAAATGEFWFR